MKMNEKQQVAGSIPDVLGEDWNDEIWFSHEQRCLLESEGGSSGAAWNYESEDPGSSPTMSQKIFSMYPLKNP